MGRWNGNLSREQKILFNQIDKIDLSTAKELIKKIAFDNNHIENYLIDVFVDVGRIGVDIQYKDRGIEVKTIYELQVT